MNKVVEINRNILWAELFVNELYEQGVRHVCISPGSRSTPLTFAFAHHPGYKRFVHIDERSGGFFALGLAKQLNAPVVLVCTSGTAAAEFYPALIEAHQGEVPLIVCTADRPPELLACGANQTIDQDKIYANHINWSFNVGLPEITRNRLNHVKTLARRAVLESNGTVRGPVHLNFPFRKPFEPDNFTDRIDAELLKQVRVHRYESFTYRNHEVSPEAVTELAGILVSKEKGLFVVGPGDFGENFAEQLSRLSAYLGYPILADGASSLRYGNHDSSYILTHFDAYLKSEDFSSHYKPEIILQFGMTVSSKGLEQFLQETDALRFHINPSGKWIDQSGYLEKVIPADPSKFCKALLSASERLDRPVRIGEWRDGYDAAERLSSRIRSEMIDCTDTMFEGKIIREVLKAVPENARIMISNSMPIRDLDYFASHTRKKIHIYTNRGASGIDGITSTALGIATGSDRPTILITGDLAFYHDLNGLIAARKYRIPLVIVLINNNGGGIFEILPISEYQEVFREYFLTPHDLDFGPIVNAYGGSYHLADTWERFGNALHTASESNAFSVIECRTDAVGSMHLRKKYWNEVNAAISKWRTEEL